MLYNLIKDKLFLLAISAALLFWLWLYFINSTTINPGWPINAPFTFLLLGLVYPVLEEIVFRGMLQPGLLQRAEIFRQHWFGFSLANGVTSLIFMALHFWQHPPLWALGVFIPSMLFGFFRDRYNSVLPGILLHCFYNLGYFWLFHTP